MNKSDFDFDLPHELIAQEPLAERSASRLLCLDVPAATWEDCQFRQLPDLLHPGDLVIFNDTRVLPARLYGHKPTGGQVEIMLERVIGSHEARAQLRVSKKPADGSVIILEDGSEVQVLGRDGEFFLLRFDAGEPLEKRLAHMGHMPLPPYIERADDIRDKERYQTIFAKHGGAVAAPTAGLHFDPQLMEALAARGIDTGCVTLHVGAGTFQPMRAEKIEDHHMHREWLNVGAELVEQVRRTKAKGGRVIAVGTTVVRSLETACQDGELKPFSGETNIFIFPGYKFHVIDGLVTNFHLPKSTLVMLVAALAGRELILSAYRHAVEARYRFFSYGDAMLILPHGR
ncbi:MAG TPA: tRNA preQ1(34) S-adenosylmethionine ribosyltransferase-isomerase QueA [Rhodanobacteraceae bacterium]